jgi:hypothetical protein
MKRTLYIIMAALMGLMATGCRTAKTVTVEVPVLVHDTTREVRTEYIFQRDTIINNTETIVREANKGDSALLAKLGLWLDKNNRTILVLHNELEQTRSELTNLKSDSSYNHKETPVPIKETVEVEVEKKLQCWQIWLILTGAIVWLGALGFVLWKTKDKWTEWIKIIFNKE